MKKFLTMITIVVLVSGTAYVVGLIRGGDRGVTVPGWEHGYALCKEVIVIDPGHHRDPEVTQLFNLIDEKCSK